VVGTEIAGSSGHGTFTWRPEQARPEMRLDKKFGMLGSPFTGGSKVLRLELPCLRCVPLVLARAAVDRRNVGGSLPAWSLPR
jgi:hypothetical protein